ncbi:MAG: ATP-dependent Clp protease proteolytic subunit, partial [Clostridia bacterium]|nr:ATP-dependent Clp protease proteolytic subunit [Clostridia bacterium]
MRHFWNWVKNANETRALFLEGVIAEESWFSDEVTPAMFKEELFAGSGPILLHINSPGGDCIAASQIYTMLMDYPHDITVQIDGMAA